jgi:hypothetical protein
MFRDDLPEGSKHITELVCLDDDDSKPPAKLQQTLFGATKLDPVDSNDNDSKPSAKLQLTLYEAVADMKVTKTKKTKSDDLVGGQRTLSGEMANTTLT